MSVRALTLLLAGILLAAGSASAQPPRDTASAGRVIAALDVELDWEKANAVLDEDRVVAAVVDSVLRVALGARYVLADSTRLGAAQARLHATGDHCRTVACAAAVGREVGADRVLLAKLTKISTPVWFVTGTLVDVRTGRVLRADEFELKGQPADIVPKGMVVLARRMSAL